MIVLGSITWQTGAQLITFLVSVAGGGWWLSRQLGAIRESLIRIEGREEAILVRTSRLEGELPRVESELDDLARRLDKRIQQIQSDSGRLRERVAVLESRIGAPHTPHPSDHQ